MKNTESKFISDFGKTSFKIFKEVAWPSGLRRWFKAPVSSEAWVRIPPLPKILRGHTDLNHGPIGLQPIALPLSYIPYTRHKRQFAE